MLTMLNSAEMTEKTWKILLFLMMNPESAKEFVLGVVLAYLAISITLAKAHILGGTGSGSIIIGLIVTLIGIFGMIEVAVLSDMLLLPLMNKEFKTFGYCVSIIAGFFLLLIPFTRTFFRATYGSSIMAWVLASAVGGGVLMAVDYYCVDSEKEDTSIESVQRYSGELKVHFKEKVKQVRKEGLNAFKEKPAAPKPATPEKP